MEVEISPRFTSSKRSVKYRESAWRVHEFEVWCRDVELVCRVVALRMAESLLVWVGGRSVQLGEVALAMPLEANVGHGVVATTLLGEEGAASGLARRLALALGTQVHVCYGQTFDRFTTPLVETGIIAELKKNPNFFCFSPNNVMLKTVID